MTPSPEDLAGRLEPEPIAWRIRRGASNIWSYCETESDADFYGGAGGMRYVKEPLYSAQALLAREREVEEWKAKFDALWREYGGELAEASGQAVGADYLRQEAEDRAQTAEASLLVQTVRVEELEALAGMAAAFIGGVQEARTYSMTAAQEQAVEMLLSGLNRLLSPTVVEGGGGSNGSSSVSVQAGLRSTEGQRDAEWQSIDTAPKNATEVLVLWPKRTGWPKHCLMVAHWAHGGGDDQPAFGPGWFRWDGYGFTELSPSPTHWMPLPEPPALSTPSTSEGAPEGEGSGSGFGNDHRPWGTR